MAPAFTSLAWACNADFGHLLLICTRSFTADLIRGCSEMRSKLILLSIKLVPASSPYECINDQMFEGLWYTTGKHVLTWGTSHSEPLPCTARLASPEDDGLTAREGHSCFQMLLQFSPSLVTSPYWNVLGCCWQHLLPGKGEQEENLDVHLASLSQSAS